MRYALFSDIHSNIEAFDAVLADISEQGVAKKIFLGDIVGYGPNPNECIERVREVADVTLGGNHDWATVDKTASDYFNPYAKEAMIWTQRALTAANRTWLEATVAVDYVDDFQVAHSSPLEPEEWRYILSYQEAEMNYPAMARDLCFIGHSHQPLVIVYDTNGKVAVKQKSFIPLEPGNKHIVNIGSVGQPRDGNVKSCWALYDSEKKTIEYRRVDYDIAAVQAKMTTAGLPQYLVDRLATGR